MAAAETGTVGPFAEPRRQCYRTAMTDGSPKDRIDYEAALTRWAAAGLIDAPTGERIRAYEASQPRAAADGPGVLEVIVYLGIAIAAAGVGVLVGTSWPDLRDWARIMVVAVPAAVALGLGQALRRLPQAELVRGGHATWLVATALCGVLAAVSAEVAGWDDEDVVLVTGAAAFGVAIFLWVAAASGPQVLGVAAPLILVAIGLAERADDSGAGIAGFAILGFGATMLALGEAGRFYPRPAVRLLGAAETAVGAYVASIEHGGFEVVAAVVAAALVAVALPRRSLVILSAGVALFFVVLVTAVLRHIDDPATAAAALIVVGIALVACVLLIARSHLWQNANRRR